MKEDNTEKKVQTNKTTKKEVKKPVKKTTKKDETIEVVKKSIEFSLVEVIFIVLITGIAVSVASGLIIYKNYDRLNVPTTINKDEFSDFYDNYNRIINNYVEEVDKKELIDAAISGMYNYLGDEYSVYISEEDSSDLKEQLDGEYTGIGVEIYTSTDETGVSTITINRIFENTPAEKAGLKVGDILTKIDGVAVSDGAEFASIVKKGNKATYDITYIRDGVEKTVTIKREKVFINSVSSETHGTVGYIKIETFSATTESQVIKYLDGFDKKVTSLVIDLRDNTGGYLDTAYNVADLFVEKGKVIYQVKDRTEKITSYKAEDGVHRRFNKIVVLVNGNSASASEILTLALKESAGATVVGTKTYGKGTVQESKVYSDGSMSKFTISYWLGPNGTSINKEGITPDIVVEKVENQLDEALKAAK